MRHPYVKENRRRICGIGSIFTRLWAFHYNKTKEIRVMKTRVRLLGALFAVAALFPAATLDGCTIFTLAKDGVVLVGNNEDWWNPKTRMWFVPAREGAFGFVYFGVDNLFHQGGMNDRGLFFDANALPQKKLPPSGLPRFKGDLIDHVMKTCSTVEEVVKAVAAHDANAVLVR